MSWGGGGGEGDHGGEGEEEQGGGEERCEVETNIFLMRVQKEITMSRLFCHKSKAAKISFLGK